MRISGKEGLSFDDVLLVPQEGRLEKREQADISSRLVGTEKLDVPIISAPMESVTGGDMAYHMRRLGGFGLLHRNQTISKQVDTYAAVENAAVLGLKKGWANPAGAAIGVNEGYGRWEHLAGAGVSIVCLDIAHAHHSSVAKFLDKAPGHLRNMTYIIVGNVATYEGAKFLADLGVDGIKVGIGPGAACTTREVTGFGVPQLTAIIDVAKALKPYGLERPTLIADGGIRNSGDIVKALAAGADSVMLGRLLAGANESPLPGHYWGMASKRVNNHRAPEGVEGVVALTGPVEETIKQLAWGIRSAISYGGGENLDDLRKKAEFILVSSGTQNESGVRI